MLVPSQSVRQPNRPALATAQGCTAIAGGCPVQSLQRWLLGPQTTVATLRMVFFIIDAFPAYNPHTHIHVAEILQHGRMGRAGKLESKRLASKQWRQTKHKFITGKH